MGRLAGLSGARVIKALERLGFVVLRQRGSHVVLGRDNVGGRTGCVVPLHRELAEGTTRGILKQAAVALDDFLNAL